MRNGKPYNHSTLITSRTGPGFSITIHLDLTADELAVVNALLKLVDEILLTLKPTQ